MKKSNPLFKIYSTSRIVIWLSLLNITIQFGFANVINVPADSSSIQSAVNAAQENDTVIVAPGTYYENIILTGRNIVLTSHYIFANDTSAIKNTIINGSTPQHPDTASCIIIYKGEDSTTVIQGFTLTEGKGTTWPDIEFGNVIFREGGGILIDESSPTIRNNYIINNIVDNKNNVSSCGGGGIRVHHGNPTVINNLIMGNKAHYGGAIVAFFSGGKFKNNIIAGNYTWQDHGGATVWLSQSYQLPKIFENNTIVGNISDAQGGGIRIDATSAVLKNNIIWCNIQSSGEQIAGANQSISSYNNYQGTLAGLGNFSEYPMFSDTNLFLLDESPCIDKGDTSAEYNDQEDGFNSEIALWPSQSGLRNDIGCYGGPNTTIFPSFSIDRFAIQKSVSLGNLNKVGIPVSKRILVVNQRMTETKIDSVIVSTSVSQITITYSPQNNLKTMQTDTISIKWTPLNAGTYFDTLLIYHNAATTINPLKVVLNGNAKAASSINKINSNLPIKVYPNPFNEVTQFQFSDINPENKFMVFNLSGNLIFSAENISTNYQFYRNGIMAGIYFYQIIAADKCYSGKIIIKD